MASYDAVVIGAGPGGYVAAIRLAQLGKKTALIEKYNSLGGTCLNVGCIPSKALLDSSEHYHQAAHQFKEHGIDVKGLSINFPQMIQRKEDVITQTVQGIRFLMKKNKVDVIHGFASFVDAKTINIKKEDGSVETITSENTIIATGSRPSNLKGVTIDKQRIITSTEAL